MNRSLVLLLAALLVPACGGRTISPSRKPPPINNPPLTTFRWDPIDKLDLLFVIDNSPSMSDKQNILAAAVPQLVDRLINPIEVCSDAQGNTVPLGPHTACNFDQTHTQGPAQEFKPLNDIHIGVITSSLGGHGRDTNFCNPQGPDKTNPDNNDHGHLLPFVRSGLLSYKTLGFLNFDGANGIQLETDFTNYVKATGQRGCRFASSLEAWYRFLADPAPPAGVKVVNNYSQPDGVDQEVLKERSDFLRPDSLLDIVMLTDKDDCSVSDSGLGWLVARQDHMPRATSACAADPNSKCCRSCALQESSPPQGCQAIKNDPSCTKGAFTDKEDPVNLRCFQEKRRFGLDLLYPTQRYVNALSQLQICPNHADLACQKGDTPQANPIYTDLNQTGAIVRDPSLVFLTAITGVPWQDIATQDSLTDPTKLQYKTAAQLKADGTWDDILGDVNKYIPPKDPLMQESIDPRSGTNPITGDAIAPPSAGANANPENGHEYDIPGRNALQYACIFPLAQPRPNSPDCATYGQPGVSPDNPVCQNPADGSYGTTQYFAKAYPGLRQLQVLKDFGDNAIVASICPKVTTGDPTRPDYGYNPAVNAIVEFLKSVLGGACLPRKLQPDTDPTSSTYGQVPCEVVEALPPGAPDAYDCRKKPGRAPLGDKQLLAAARSKLEQEGQCDGAGQPACSDFSVCQILQLTEQTGLESCRNDQTVKSGVDGYCYIDQSCVDAKTCNGQLISRCPDTEKRLLRLVPAGDTPTPGATIMVACAGP